jgi:DNA-binding MurR/RpiR family transcriptional regulator
MKIRSAYSTLPTAERKVADFILEDPERASLMVINEIADSANVSVPSVTRLAKKLGYAGFLDFRVSLASGNASLESLKSDPVRPEDSDEKVVEKAFLSSMRALEDTLKAIDKHKLALLARKIVQADRIYVFGTAASAATAADMASQLNFLGYDALAVADPIVMDVYTKRFSPNDVFIGISRSGRTKQILDAVKLARQHNCFTAFLSNYINSPAAQVVDCFFCTCRIDDMKAVVGRESNLSMLATIGALVMLVARSTQAVSPAEHA